MSRHEESATFRGDSETRQVPASVLCVRRYQCLPGPPVTASPTVACPPLWFARDEATASVPAFQNSRSVLECGAAAPLWFAHEAASRMLNREGVCVVGSRTKAVLRTALQKDCDAVFNRCHRIPAAARSAALECGATAPLWFAYEAAGGMFKGEGVCVVRSRTKAVLRTALQKDGERYRGVLAPRMRSRSRQTWALSGSWSIS